VQKVFTVEISNFEFSPAELKISVGSNVTWVNRDTTPHTATSDSGGKGGISSTILENGDRYTKQFMTVGTYPYHCNFHNSMKGKIVVE
jgi:amicyanin